MTTSKFWGDEPLDPDDPRVKYQRAYEAQKAHMRETGHVRFCQTLDGFECREGDWGIKLCRWDTDGDGNCAFHPKGCPDMSTAPEDVKLAMMRHSIEEGLKSIVRALVSAGLDPLQSVSLVEETVASIRKTVETAVERGATP